MPGAQLRRTSSSPALESWGKPWDEPLVLALHRNGRRVMRRDLFACVAWHVRSIRCLRYIFCLQRAWLIVFVCSSLCLWTVKDGHGNGPYPIVDSLPGLQRVHVRVKLSSCIDFAEGACPASSSGERRMGAGGATSATGATSAPWRS